MRGVERLAPGTYPYFCTVHEQMRGSIVVTGSAQPAPDVPRLVPAPTGATVPSPTSITFQSVLTDWLADPDPLFRKFRPVGLFH